ncbi:protein kinase [Micromonospora sp. NPDC006766]|uniref:protein kinase domain-containing protein n=1 Tax=Micromonospora sp. NPDC006766 TaxID=3154778 RepID=UPI0033F13BA7
MSPFTPALRLHDRYVLHERIGLGGMSEVWRADDEVLHRPVAVKALATQLAADPQLRATIQREARAAARLTHPHVTQVYDYAEATLPDGSLVPYLVMELVEGHTLADRLAGGPLAWPEAIRLAGQVAAALAAAHRIGVVHRDIKPGNVMLTETGAKVLDFGIATLAGPRHPLAGQTGELLMGTPAYFAPERMKPGPPNPASDVYALGALLYRTLTGRAPLPVQTWQDVLDVQARQTPVPPLYVPGLPADLAELTLACLSVDPDRRPSAAQLAARFGAGQPVDPPTAILPTVTRPAHPPTLIDRAAAPVRPPVTSSRPPARSNRLLVGLVAAGVALLLGLVGTQLLGDHVDQPQGAGAATTAPADEPPASDPSDAAPESAATEPSAASEPPATTTRPVPVTARQLAAQFAELLAQAQTTGKIDRKTADSLRKKAAELDRGKPKDRGKRLADLRQKIDKAADEGKLDAGAAANLQGLLDVYEQLRGDGPDDD